MRALVLAALLVASAAAGPAVWCKGPPLPNKEGVAGSFAGVSNGALLVAGGANFPDKKPWEGGKKVWHDTVVVLEKPDGVWKVAGTLPRPLGYGVSVTHGTGVVCVGGSDAERHYADAFRLDWQAGKLVITALPPMPGPVANACGALVGDTLYVAGGLDSPGATTTLSTLWTLDLAARQPRWVKQTDLPTGRMLAVAAGADRAFWLVGGVDLGTKGERRYLKDAWRYDPAQGWKRLADLPAPVCAAPSPAPTDRTGFYLLGGDDGTQVGVAPEKQRGFGRTLLRYDVKVARWIDAGEMAAAHVTTPCVAWGGTWVVPSGEVRPGVRSPAVWIFTPGRPE